MRATNLILLQDSYKNLSTEEWNQLQTFNSEIENLNNIDLMVEHNNTYHSSMEINATEFAKAKHAITFTTTVERMDKGVTEHG